MRGSRPVAAVREDVFHRGTTAPARARIRTPPPLKKVAAVILAAVEARILAARNHRPWRPHTLKRYAPFPPGWKPRLYGRQDARRYGLDPPKPHAWSNGIRPQLRWAVFRSCHQPHLCQAVRTARCSNIFEGWMRFSLSPQRGEGRGTAIELSPRHAKAWTPNARKPVWCPRFSVFRFDSRLANSTAVEGRGEGWNRAKTLAFQERALGTTTPHPQSLSPLRGEGSPLWTRLPWTGDVGNEKVFRSKLKRWWFCD